MSTTTTPNDIAERVAPAVPSWAPAIGEFVACDRCRHRSCYYALVNGTRLSYCYHHSNKYEVGLLAASNGNVHDLRHTLES